ncbi:MAG: hypothetical protein AB1847_16620 [bacterium]
MRTGLTPTQTAIISASTKKPSWLFEIDRDNDGTVDYYWSTETRTWDSHTYTARIISFTPLTLTGGNPELGIISPATITIQASFKNSNIGGIYASDFEGASIMVRLVCAAGADEAELMSWRFQVIMATSVDQVLTLECQDWFTLKMDGDYPNTSLICDLFPADIMKNDGACVPLIFGTPFFPVRWIINRQEVEYYVDSNTFAVPGDQRSLFSIGQFLLANCGTDGIKAGWVSSNSLLNSGVLVSHQGGNSPYIWQAVSCEVGETYRISVYGKMKEEATLIMWFATSSGGAGATTHTWEATSSWGLQTMDVVASQTTMYVLLMVSTSTFGHGAFFDDAAVQKIEEDWSLGPNLLTNGGFNGDKSLYWTVGNLAGMGSISPGHGDPSTRITLTASSGALTSNLVSVQTDHYLLGPADKTYTIDRARTPREVNFKTTYLPADYDFKQDSLTGRDGESYRAVQVLCDDADKDGINDANGFWGIIGKEIYDMPLRFSRSDLSAVTNPADIAKWVFEDWGIPSGEIDDTSRAAAAAVFTARGVSLNIALWFRMPREKFIAKLFTLAGMIPVYRDKINFKVLTTTSQMTITEDMADPGSFQIRRTYDRRKKDSGYVNWQTSDEPVDQVNKTLVAVKSSTDDCSDTTIEAEWILDSIKAQKSGKLALQRILLRDKTITFTANSKILALEPGDVITISPQNFGAEGSSYDCLISRMFIREDLSVDVECVKFSDELDDWDDVTASDITIGDANTERGVSPVYQGPTDATAAAAGENTANVITQTVMIGAGGILATNSNPAGQGGFQATNEHLTCYNTSGQVRFKAVYAGADQGDVIIGDYDNGRGVKWDQSTAKLTVKVDSDGGISVSGGGDISLEGSDTDPGRVKFTGTSYSVEIGGDADGNRFLIKPDTNNAVDCHIGINGAWWGEEDTRFRDIRLYAKRQGFIACGDWTGAVNGAAIEVDGDVMDSEPVITVTLYDKTSQTLAQYLFKHTKFTPIDHKTCDLGGAAAAWDNAYADDWNNVADFFWLDHRKDGEKIVPVDDVEVIKAIKPSGVFDPKTGMELIDDDTLPEWLLSRDKTGKILKDPDNKPYLSLRTMISLCMGAIRRLSDLIDHNREQIDLHREQIDRNREQIDRNKEQIDLHKEQIDSLKQKNDELLSKQHG